MLLEKKSVKVFRSLWAIVEGHRDQGQKRDRRSTEGREWMYSGEEKQMRKKSRGSKEEKEVER